MRKHEKIRIPTTSAGGILFRIEGSLVRVAIVERKKDVPPKWKPILRQLPKGSREKGERIAQTALREVLEETGYRGKIISHAGNARWVYERGGEEWIETVHYFFMMPSSLSPQRHDDEFDRVRWVGIKRACEILSYPEERELLVRIVEEKAIDKLGLKSKC